MPAEESGRRQLGRGEALRTEGAAFSMDQEDSLQREMEKEVGAGVAGGK